MFLSKRTTFSLPQPAQVWQILLVTFAGALLITGSLYWAGVRMGIPLSHLTGDPAMITGTPIYIGVLSNFGVMLWGAAAACAFLGAAQEAGKHRRFQFLIASGLFSALLGVDDLLTIHEHVLPHYLHVPEIVAYFGYICLAVIFLLWFLKEIFLETDYPILAAALFFFGLSVVITRIFPLGGLEVFLKDVFKFYGILFWLVFYYFTVLRFSKERT